MVSLVTLFAFARSGVQACGACALVAVVAVAVAPFLPAVESKALDIVAERVAQTGVIIGIGALVVLVVAVIWTDDEDES